MSNVYKIKCDSCLKEWNADSIELVRIVPRRNAEDYHVCQECVHEHPIAVCGIIAAMYSKSEKANV